MPRSGRGGSRVGKVGTSYAQRTDLHQGARLPVQAPKSTSYGSAAANVAAQKQVPMASVSPGPTPAGGPAEGAGAAVPGPAAPAPGSFGDPLRPTERPDEPVTSGLPFGAGPGPAAPVASPPLLGALANLNSLGSSVSPLVAAVRAQVNALNAQT